MKQASPVFRSRFWNKVQRGAHDACWPWRASTNQFGYGKFGLNGRWQLAHRVAWRLAHGPIPQGKLVLHTCDNPPCCNDAHLYLGTHKENGRDSVVRGRCARLRGATNGMAKLSSDQVASIRREWAGGRTTQTALSKSHGVTHVMIGKIVRVESWKGLPA